MATVKVSDQTYKKLNELAGGSGLGWVGRCRLMRHLILLSSKNEGLNLPTMRDHGQCRMKRRRESSETICRECGKDGSPEESSALTPR